MTNCATCDLGLSSPGIDGHICITREQQADRVREREEREGLAMPLVYEGDQA